MKNVNNSVISCPISIKIVFPDSHSSALPSHTCCCYLFVFVYLSVSLKVVKILVSTHLNHSCTLRYHQISWSHDVPETQIFVPNHCPPYLLQFLNFSFPTFPSIQALTNRPQHLSHHLPLFFLIIFTYIIMSFHSVFPLLAGLLVTLFLFTNI